MFRMELLLVCASGPDLLFFYLRAAAVCVFGAFQIIGIQYNSAASMELY